MFRTLAKALLAIVASGSFFMVPPASAQPPFRFKFKPGMELLYETIHSTEVQVDTPEGKSATGSKVEQVKEWKVMGVDSRGVATIELTIRRLRLTQTEPDGSILSFDSTDWRNSHKDLIEQLGKLVDKPVLRVQVAADGTVKQVEPLGEQKSLPKELPFHLTYPDELPRVGFTWQRDFAISLDPPFGKGQAYKAAQVCTIDRIEGDKLVVNTETRLADSVDSADDRISLSHFLPKGKVTLDLARGVVADVEQTVEQRVDDFAGPESSYVVKTEYSERLVDSVANRNR